MTSQGICDEVSPDSEDQGSGLKQQECEDWISSESMMALFSESFLWSLSSAQLCSAPAVERVIQ